MENKVNIKLIVLIFLLFSPITISADESFIAVHFFFAVSGFYFLLISNFWDTREAPQIKALKVILINTNIKPFIVEFPSGISFFVTIQNLMS